MANEKRLIDANALGIGKAKREAFDNPVYADGWNSAIAIIEQAPTVDAVEVVRCEECHLHLKCPTEERFHLAKVKNPYCCLGERREGE